MSPIFSPAMSMISRRRLPANLTWICWPIMPQAKPVKHGGQIGQAKAAPRRHEIAMTGFERRDFIVEAQHPQRRFMDERHAGRTDLSSRHATAPRRLLSPGSIPAPRDHLPSAGLSRSCCLRCVRSGLPDRGRDRPGFPGSGNRPEAGSGKPSRLSARDKRPGVMRVRLRNWRWKTDSLSKPAREADIGDLGISRQQRGSRMAHPLAPQPLGRAPDGHDRETDRPVWSG